MHIYRYKYIYICIYRIKKLISCHFLLQIVSSEVLCTPESSYSLQQLTKHVNDDKTLRFIKVPGDIMSYPQTRYSVKAVVADFILFIDCCIFQFTKYIPFFQCTKGTYTSVGENEQPPIFVFTQIFRKNTPVIRTPTIFLMYTFQILCVHSRGQRSSSPDELNDTLHDKIALPDELQAHAISSQIAWISE